jgi:hypothetical protein
MEYELLLRETEYVTYVKNKRRITLRRTIYRGSKSRYPSYYLKNITNAKRLCCCTLRKIGLAREVEQM